MEQVKPEDRWVVYFHGYGKTSPLNICDTLEEAQSTHPECTWYKNSDRDYIGFPFDNRSFPHNFTANRDGQAVFDMMKDIESRPKGILTPIRRPRHSIFGRLFKGIGKQHAIEEERKRQDVLYWTNRNK